MQDVTIIGDGPADLSAALFLAKKGMSVTVFAQDKTAMHSTLLINYLGIVHMTGSEFQKIARQQVADFGARIFDLEVEEVHKTNNEFSIKASDNAMRDSEYLILANGPGYSIERSGQSYPRL